MFTFFFLFNIFTKIISYAQRELINIGLLPLYLFSTFVKLFFGVNFDIYEYTSKKILSINRKIINLISPRNIMKNILYIIK